MALANKEHMPNIEGKKKSALKPVLYCILAFFLIAIMCNIIVKQELFNMDGIAKIYLYPYQGIVFLKPISNFVAGIVMVIICFFTYAFTQETKTKSNFYIVGTIGAYLVYLGIWFFLKAISLSFFEITTEENLTSIVPLVGSCLLMVALFAMHLIMASATYKEHFIEESESFQARVRLEKINEQKAKRKEEEEKTKTIKEAKMIKEKVTKDIKTNETTVRQSGNFAENKELADKIRSSIKDVPLDKKLSFDTNVMIKCPLLVKELSKKYSIILSKKVFEELDKKKVDKEIGSNARMAMKIIESIQTEGGNISIIPVGEEFLKENGLNVNSPDDIIIGCYLNQKVKGENILFVSEDRGARITARNVNVDVLEI